jgi:anti-sigma factor (TIGR02949 family)
MMQHLTDEKLIDYLHGALAPQDDAAVYAHIEACPECRKRYDTEVALTEMLRSHNQHEERELPATLKAEIWQRIREQEAPARGGFWSMFRPALALPVAAALALGLYFGVWHNGSGAPTIEAAYYLQDHAALNSTVPFNDHGTINPDDLESSANSNQTAVEIEAASYTADANR